MAAPLHKPMTGEEFEVWHRGQTERYEFVDGAPRPKFSRWEGAKMMVGATQGHNLIAGNAYSELRRSLQDKPCRPFLADGKVVTPQGNFRYPDVVVDCGRFERSATSLRELTLVIEVLSKSTQWIDATRKLEDYKSVPSMRHILLLSQDEARGQLWTRAGDWRLDELAGIEAQARLSALDVVLSFDAVYANAQLDPE